MEHRRSFYLLLTVIAVAIATAKVVGVENVYEPSRFAPPPGTHGDGRIDAPSRVWPAIRPAPTPTMSSNDRSRWTTVRALVDDGTFVIGHRMVYEDPKTDTGIVFEDGWQSLDKVMNPETHDYYSSKPPLFAVMLAGEYWLLKQATGLSIGKNPWPVMCTILITVNIVPFAIALILLSRLIEQYGTTDFGRLIAFATAAVGTFWITFSHTLNNHTPAACCVVFAIYPLLRTPTVSVFALILSGFFAALTATFDLPAASFAAALLVMTTLRVRVRSLYFLAGMVIPIIAFFLANYAALGRWLPAYGEFGGPWYDYPGSHWAKLQLAKHGTHIPGIDFAKESRGTYLLHCLIGHHGGFSLTPIWLIGMLGCMVTCRTALGHLRLRETLSFPLFVQLGWMLFLILVVFFVYIQRTNNYGGNTSGLRWFFWLIPLGVLCTLAGADRLAHIKWCRGLITLLLGLSVISAFYPAWNPWRSPWLMVLMERWEVVNYERR